MAVWLHSCLLIDCQCLFSFAWRKKNPLFVSMIACLYVKARAGANTARTADQVFLFLALYLFLHFLLWFFTWHDDWMENWVISGLHKWITVAGGEGPSSWGTCCSNATGIILLLKSNYILVQGCWCRCRWESSHRNRRIWVIESHHQFIHTTRV